MHIQQNGNVPSHAVLLLVGIAVGSWLLAATPAQALSDNQQLLTGGVSLGEGVTQFTSPGLSLAYTPDSPAAGKGESAAQLRMPEGILRGLRVKVTPATVPSSGTLSVTVRKNGLNTILTCSVAAAGNCNAVGPVAIANNDRLSVQVINSFIGSSTTACTYTLLFD